jgi:hypothetical protein
VLRTIQFVDTRKGLHTKMELTGSKSPHSWLLFNLKVRCYTADNCGTERM